VRSLRDAVAIVHTGDASPSTSAPLSVSEAALRHAVDWLAVVDALAATTHGTRCTPRQVLDASGVLLATSQSDLRSRVRARSALVRGAMLHGAALAHASLCRCPTVAELAAASTATARRKRPPVTRDDASASGEGHGAESGDAGPRSSGRRRKPSARADSDFEYEDGEDDDDD